ncbi:MAG: hypothetical protein CVU56_02225 [Deltaproteobacteria bacterium HGW-Deltaproteobacteria-14]|nr:MAG: hypothetical protein CVU56_02225 [Deltaproteobacteria bacterium HGW-Deltaproteobacteria-14]
MADNDDTNASKPKLDASDLKARLGLKRKLAAPPAPPAPTPPKAAPGTPAPPSAESIAEARERSAKAMAEAGPALEEFSVVGHEKTPLPAELPQSGVRVEYVSVGADASYPGMEKKRRTMMIVLAVGVGIVAYLLGGMMGDASLKNEMRDSYVREAKEKSTVFEANKDTIAAIVAFKEQLKAAAKNIHALADDPKADPKALEATFNELVPVLTGFVKSKAYIDPDTLMGKTMYNGELMRDVVDFSVRTVLLNNAVVDGLEEIRTFLKMSAPPAQTTRSLLVERAEREVEGLGSLPVANGAWILDSGPPQQVDLVDGNNGQVVGKEWQLKVLVADEEDPRQVPTAQVMQLDLQKIYDERTEFAKRLSYERLAEIVDKLDKLASGVNPEAILKRIQEWAAKEI